MAKLLRRVLVLLCWLPLMAQAETFQEGVHYDRLPQAVPTMNRDQVEVNEMFWYGCPHCYNLEPLVLPWSKQLPEGAYFTKTPAMFSAIWKTHAQLFYTVRELNLGDEVDVAIFEAYHQMGNRLDTPEKMAAFLKPYGISAEQFNEAYNSFGVKNQMQQAYSKARGYQIRGVPAIIVNGKYRITGQSAGSNAKMIEVATYLVERELKARQ
ncbi:thiol:disulfide interchange protein DsbA/DsbL [Aestuariirhabdus sp. Z084]|uniref:thiol:disulfide interchange protein DsbA/DsbL n=1 Tax=Aestuariirhabdus haliotis TaxID=2918751 RepID=UPI00201B358C|nr:thiol:disulfide interchange protein DsbA/DsbL [Aestuariirhabdus haliotis]MCL6414288.1 thiol:disulfide interchange protein DsbA/DsbL [Aestuariirhabdus haliotis]MCL6418220.1 thiol:disulfide interchange protein DsbA/DsbL [Aestuariirhabdus haliotis]